MLDERMTKSNLKCEVANYHKHEEQNASAFVVSSKLGPVAISLCSEVQN